MTQFSPAAQAVMNAWVENTLYAPIDNEPLALAAALRAVADLPRELEIPFNVITDWEAIPGSCARLYAAAMWGYNQALETQRTIANELDTYHD